MEHATVQGAVSRLISTERLEANTGGKNHRSRTWRPSIVERNLSMDQDLLKVDGSEGLSIIITPHTMPSDCKH